MSEALPPNIDALVDALQSSPTADDNLHARLDIISQLSDLLMIQDHTRGLFCLLETLKQETHPKVVIHTIGVTSRMNLQSAVMTLIDLALGSGVAVFDDAHDLQEMRQSDAGIKIRTAAIRALAKFQDDRAVVPLMSILNDKAENYRLRLVAAETLGRIGDDHVVRPLLDIVKDEREKSVYLKESAVKALGMLGDIRALESLLDEMEQQKGFWNKFLYLKENLFEAIGRVGTGGSEKIRASLLAALRDDAPSIRLAAVDALCELDDVSVIPELLPMVNDTDDDVAHSAIDALYELGGRETLQALLAQDNLPQIMRETILNYLLEDGIETED